MNLKPQPAGPKILWILCLLALLWTACDKEKEPIPGFLNIQSFTVLPTDPALHGSISSKITHARISLLDPVDSTSQLIGMFELPASIPVLAEGAKIASIDPVIKANGNSFYLQAYPFYERFYGTVNIVPGEETAISPTTTYSDEAEFVFVEDFEGSSHVFTFEQDGNAETFVEASADDVFEGARSGKITLDTANFLAIVATDTFYTLDFSATGRIFMEVNYKTEVPIEFGLIAVDNTLGLVPNFEFVVLAKNEWNKIYFDLTDLVASATVDKFYVVFRTYIPIENGQPTRNEATVYLDNIKLIHF